MVKKSAICVAVGRQNYRDIAKYSDSPPHIGHLFVNGKENSFLAVYLIVWIFTLEMAKKDRVSTADNWSGHPMKLNNPFNKFINHHFCCIWVRKSKNMLKFT